MDEFRQAWRVDHVKVENLQHYLNEISRLGMLVRDLNLQGSPGISPGDTILCVSYKNVKPQGLGMAVRGIVSDQFRYKERREITETMEEDHIESETGKGTQLTLSKESPLLGILEGSTREIPPDELTGSPNSNIERGSKPGTTTPTDTILPTSRSSKPELERRPPPLASEATQRGRTPEGHSLPVRKGPRQETASGRAWRSYQKAYEHRWGVEPLPNAKSFTLLGMLVGRIGKDNAPDVAAFYLTHNDRLYINAKHPITLLLRDAEKLYAEWKTGHRSSATEANRTDRQSSNLNAMQDFLKETK